MSYQVLARRLRPATFQTLIGQEHITVALTNALDSGRLHSAYLFTGIRGTGKTSLARLLAKSLSCQQGVSSKPCLKCDACESIALGEYVDLIEIDAASKTKVEDTRELLENVHYMPSCGRFKIYLIDEVHMLSGHSFNALLKTLEEPPEHVKFIFATTDYKKIPDTVLSRCLHFKLKPFKQELLASAMMDILTDESIIFEQAALTLLAKFAHGSMRDALSLLERAITTNKKIDLISVRKMLGVAEQEVLVELLSHIVQEKLGLAMGVVQTMYEDGLEFQLVLDNLLELLHVLALNKAGLQSSLAYEFGDLSSLAEIDATDLQVWYQIVLLAKRDLDLSPSPKLALEMLVLRLASFILLEKDLSRDLPKDLHKLEHKKKVNAGIVNNGIEKNDREAKLQPLAVKPEAGRVDNAQVKEVSNAGLGSKNVVLTAENWAEFLQELRPNGLLKIILEHTVLHAATESSLELILAQEQEVLLSKEREQQLHRLLAAKLGTNLKLTIKAGEAIKTPHANRVKAKQQRVESLEAKLKRDKGVRAIMETFAAEITEIKELEK